MKKYFFCLLMMLSLWQDIAAQLIKEFDEIAYLTTIRNFATYPLDSIWQYHAGDDSSWKNPETSTDGWMVVNTMSLKDKQEKMLDWQNIGWFRKTFTVPDSANGKMLEIKMATMGAAEVYLDGKLVIQNGMPSADSLGEERFIPRESIMVILENRQYHVLAVRYSNHHLKDVLGPGKIKGFLVASGPPNKQNAIGSFVGIIHHVVSVSFIYAFFFFFLFVYFFYPDRLASLTTAMYLVMFGAIFLVAAISPFVNDISTYTFLKSVWTICVSSIGAILIICIFSIYHGRIHPISYFIFALALINIYFIFHPNRYFGFFYLFINTIYTIEMFRVMIMGIVKKRTGFWIILIGNSLAYLGFHMFIANSFNVFSDEYISLARESGAIIPNLATPLSFALQLAWEFGSTNRNLEKQLVQVKALSEENITKEKEKQQILSTQNVKLESLVEERTASLHQSLNDLRSTQQQLIQSEKMASLGELTAGIAHEIQNPLNFVNNFSEVNKELLSDMRNEIAKRNFDEVDAIAKDVEANEDKISHHGKRADAIVKSMLQHSRASSGQIEPTDINSLADEYLRLSYHGVRAKDKGFNAAIITKFDERIESIDVIPQEIGRVLLNVYNNAFYAVAERKRIEQDGYEPIVTVTTTLKNDIITPGKSKSLFRDPQSVIITVTDNGKGIPEDMIDKIFQPFFTTKPSGEGTGLGLSLSYDIVKAHGGEIAVSLVPEGGVSFNIQLPVANHGKL